MADGVHVMPMRVYYEDTDTTGMVYHANYLRYAERARTEMMRLAGIDHTRLYDAAGVAFTVRRCTVEYVKPARLDDDLAVRTRILDMTGASIHAEQIVSRAGDDLARLTLQLACVADNGRPRRLPPVVRDAMTALTTEEARS